MKKCLYFVLAVLLVAASLMTITAFAEDVDAFVGEWKTVSATYQGYKIPESEYGKYGLTLNEDGSAVALTEGRSFTTAWTYNGKTVSVFLSQTDTMKGTLSGNRLTFKNIGGVSSEFVFEKVEPEEEEPPVEEESEEEEEQEPEIVSPEDEKNGKWFDKKATLKNTPEAQLMVRVGDIDALNDKENVVNGYNPFTAKNQHAHGYPWIKDDEDAEGTDRIFVGASYKGEACDGYASGYNDFNSGSDTENAYGKGALKVTLEYDAKGIEIKNALLQICIDDFQAVSFESNFTVKLNGKDAPFISELLNHVDQTGPTSYIVSAIIPSGFFEEIASGKLEAEIDETTGIGDGYAVDFVKLLVNYDENVFTGTFSGKTTPGAAVRLLGTSTTITTDETGGFEFKAVPGLNAIRASKSGYEEGYAFGIVLDSDTEWKPEVYLNEGESTPDIDFSAFGETEAWEKASEWAEEWLKTADKLGLIPDCLKGADMTGRINRREFASIAVKVYEALAQVKTQPIAQNPFSDCDDVEVLKAYNVGITDGTGEGEFSPENGLTRQEAATMLTRVYKKYAIQGWTLKTDRAFDEVFKATFTMPEAFADDADIDSWAKDSVYFMKAKEIINGVGDNKFAPKHGVSSEEAESYGLATREEALKIAVGMVNNLK